MNGSDKTDGWLNKKEMNEQIDGWVGEVHIEELEEDYKKQSTL